MQDNDELAQLVAAAGASFASVGYDLEVFAADKSESGFHEFVAESKEALVKLADLRDEAATLEFLKENSTIIEGIAHVRAWFFERHVGYVKSGRVSTAMDEASSFFLLDAAADAARSHFMQTKKIEGAAVQGVRMLTMGLSQKGDPVGIRKNLKAHIDLWLAVAKHAANGRKAEATKKMQNLSKKTSGRPPVGGRTATADPARLLPALGMQVLSPIAAGAFSTILRCKPQGSRAEVAVKSFDNAKCAKDPLVMDARDRELGVLALLHDHPPHPHVANLLGVLGDCVKAPHCHAILEFAAGGSLKRLLDGLKKARAPAGGLGSSLAAKATGQLAGALAHLHAHDICHQDVKPANILMLRSLPATADEATALAALHLKLCDFGFATVCGDSKLTHHCGTPIYCAPELATPADASKGYLGRPTDIWSLGCVVYELLHGKPAFQAAESFQLEQLTRGAKYAAVHESVPAAAKALIAALICAKPDKRPTAREVLERAWVKDAHAEAEKATGAAPESNSPGAGEQEKKNEGGLFGWMFGGAPSGAS